MINLNLVFPDKSDIKFKIDKFPDGQQGFTLNDNDSLLVKKDSSVLILSRLNTFLDLELIILANQSLKELDVEKVHLYVPYFIGGRSDRKFKNGSVNYLKNVISPIINSQKFASVTVMDPHSDVLEACLKSYKKIDNTPIVQFALSDIYKLSIPGNSGFFVNKEMYNANAVLVSPDAGALKKVYNIAKKTEYSGEVLVCSKYRDIDGELTQTYVPIRIDHYKKDLIIIDDLIDGGRTFINIVKEILKTQPDREGKIYLIITHGIFSAGYVELSQYFTKMYCTNSFKNIAESEYDQAGDLIQTKVKQLNIF